jgi:hypothetical protein
MLTVSQEILKQTTICRKDFCCLSDTTNNLCKVERALGAEPILFLCKEEKPCCDHTWAFGRGRICSCPVRKELNQRYGI